MLVLKSQSACATTKTSTIMEYIILNGKVVEQVVVYMGTVMLPFFNSSIQYSWLFLNKTFLLVSSVFSLLSLFVLLFVYIIVEQWRRKGGLHQV